MDESGWKWMKVVWSGWKCMKIYEIVFLVVEIRSKWVKMEESSWHWMKVHESGWMWIKVYKMDEWIKIDGSD